MFCKSFHGESLFAGFNFQSTDLAYALMGDATVMHSLQEYLFQPFAVVRAPRLAEAQVGGSHIGATSEDQRKPKPTTWMESLVLIEQVNPCHSYNVSRGIWTEQCVCFPFYWWVCLVNYH